MMSKRVTMAQDDRLTTLERDYVLLNRRMILLENFVGDKFCETFREYTIRRGAFFGSGGGGFDDGFNPRTNGRYDSFEDSEDTNDRFGQRGNARRSTFLNRRSSSSTNGTNVSHKNVPSNKRSSSGTKTCGIRKRPRISVATQPVYRVRQPSIEYQPSTPTVGLEEMLTSPRLQLLNGESIHQRACNDNYNILVEPEMVHGTSAQHAVIRSNEEKQTENTFEVPQTAENHLESKSNEINTEENSANPPVSVNLTSNAANECTIFNTIPNAATAGESEIASAKTGDKNIQFQVQDSLSNTTGDFEKSFTFPSTHDNCVSLLQKSEATAPPQLPVNLDVATPSTASQHGTTENPIIAEILTFVPSVPTPMAFTKQLDDSRVVEQSVASSLATELKTVAPLASNHHPSTKSNETGTTTSPISLGMDSFIIPANDDVLEASLIENLADAPFSTTSLESAVSSAAFLNVDKDSSGLHASINGYVEPAVIMEVDISPKSPTDAIMNPEDSCSIASRPTEIPELHTIKSAQSTVLESASGIVAQSEESMDSDCTNTSSFTARASLSHTNDSDIAIIDELSDCSSRFSKSASDNEKSNEQSVGKKIRRSTKSQRRAQRIKSASSDASVITLSSGGNSDAESKDHVGISSSPTSETTNPLNIVVVPNNGLRRDPNKSKDVIKRLQKLYPVNPATNCATQKSTFLGTKRFFTSSTSYNSLLRKGQSVSLSTRHNLLTKKTPKPQSRFLMLNLIDRKGSIPSTLTKLKLHPTSTISSNETQRGTKENLIDPEGSSGDEVIAGKNSQVSVREGRVNVGDEEENGDNEKESPEVRDQEATINVDGDFNVQQRPPSVAKEIAENETNMLNTDISSKGVEDLNVPNSSVYRCRQLQHHDTRVIITRKPSSMRGCQSISQTHEQVEMRSERRLSGAQDCVPLAINMGSLDLPLKDTVAVSPDGQPPPLIPIDDEGKADDLESEIVLDDESSNNKVDEPTMPILSVSASQTSFSLEKTIELDETRSTEDEESIPLRQPISIIPESDTRESHNSGSVNQKMPNPFIVDSVIPFLDGGSDRKCKRKTVICKMCDTSFFTSNELTEHELVHAQEALESDSDYDSQNQECDPSYKRRLKYRQHGSVRSKKSSLVKDVDQDSESESEQRPAVTNSGKNKSIARSRRTSGQSDADRENVQCPYCKTLTTKRGRRAHTKSSFCSLTKKQYDRESRFRGKLTWVPVPENPAFITWRLTAPEKSPFRRKTTQPDDLNFHDVSNHMSEVYENMPDCPNVNDRPAIPISTAAKDLVHAGPRSRIMTEQFSFISSAVVMAGGRRENGIGERYAHNHYVSSKTKSRPDSNPEKLDVSTNLQATQRTGLPDDTVQRMEEVNRDGQSEDYDHDRTSNMISPPEDVYDDLQEEHDVNQRRDTSEHSSFLQVNSDDDDDNFNLLHNQSVLTEELHSDYDDQSSATEEFTINEETSRGGGDPSTRKNLGHEIVQCPHCGKSMLQKSLQRHTERACPTQTTRKAKNSSSNARTLVCKYEDCGFIPSNSNQYREHLAVHPIGEGHACTFKKCGKIFIEELNLLDHIRTHSINVPHDATGVSIKGSKRLQPELCLKKLPSK